MRVWGLMHFAYVDQPSAIRLQSGFACLFLLPRRCLFLSCGACMGAEDDGEALVLNFDVMMVFRCIRIDVDEVKFWYGI